MKKQQTTPSKTPTRVPGMNPFQQAMMGKMKGITAPVGKIRTRGAARGR